MTAIFIRSELMQNAGGGWVRERWGYLNMGFYLINFSISSSMVIKVVLHGKMLIFRVIVLYREVSLWDVDLIAVYT